MCVLGGILDDEYFYEVERVLKCEEWPNGEKKVLVRWRDFGPQADCWIPEANLCLPLSAYQMETTTSKKK